MSDPRPGTIGWHDLTVDDAGDVATFYGELPAAPLIARWEAMLDTLKSCKRRAKCLARTIQRWKADGEARPCITPIPKTYAMPAALGLVSGALTVQLTEALRDWPVQDTS